VSAELHYRLSDLLDAYRDETTCKAYNGWTRRRDPHEIRKEIDALLQPLTDVEPHDDMAFLVEAYRFGQFADDMLDHPSPSCRSPGKTVREALRRVLSRWETFFPPKE
jgi:hypothetical protein